MTNIYCSIIIPLHNEQTRMREAVFKVIRYAEKNLMGRYEIILIENGSTDDTFIIARELSKTYRTVRAFQIQERSKAQAIRYGMFVAEGEYRYMCDVDLSTPIDELTRFLKVIEQGGWDVVIASREHFDSQVDTNFSRWFIGRVFHALVQGFTGLHYRDTQCGFKLFNKHAAEEIFSRTQCISMAFDVEVLYLAQRLGYYCTDIPIVWINDNESRVRIVRDSWHMLIDLLNIKKMHVNDVPLYKQKTSAA